MYAQEMLTLHPGDRLYFYTDGVTEAMDTHEEEFGHARLLEEIARWRDLPLRAGLDLMAATVRDWSGGIRKDDISLLAVERIP
jgi:phosphoserine phosphatase RsbU/P